MVGPPKTLHELSTIKAAVRLRCEDCRHEVVRGLADLIAEVAEEGGTTSWPDFRHALHCPRCGCSGAMLRPAVMPFTEGQPRRRGYNGLLINLSLAILREAAWRQNGKPRATQDVRLALHVLRSFVSDPVYLIEFWQKADVPSQHPWESCRPLFAAISAQVHREGHAVWQRNRA